MKVSRYNGGMSNFRIEFPSEKTEQMPRLLYFSYSKYEKDWASLMHCHTFTEFMYIERGEGEIVTQSSSFRVHASDFIVLPPGFHHTEKSSPRDSMEYFVLGVANIALKDYAAGEQYNPVFPLGRYEVKVGEGMRRMFNVLSKTQKGYDVEAASVFLGMMAVLSRLPSSPILLNETDSGSQRMMEVKDYIDTHYMEALTLDDLALRFHLSKFHLARRFTESCGIPPKAYLEKRRMREAEYLLSSTELSVTEIASTLGFSSSSYFTQRFRINEGMTPVEYRRKSEKR